MSSRGGQPLSSASGKNIWPSQKNIDDARKRSGIVAGSPNTRRRTHHVPALQHQSPRTSHTGVSFLHDALQSGNSFPANATTLQTKDGGDREPPSMFEIPSDIGGTSVHWHKAAFESLQPTGRKDAQSLRAWLSHRAEEAKNSDMSGDELVQQMLGLYSAAIQELSRQVTVSCADRGQLMIEIWMSQAKLLQWWMQKMMETRIQMQVQLESLQKQNSDIVGSMLQKVDIEQVLKDKDRKIAELEYQLKRVETDQIQSEENRNALQRSLDKAKKLYDDAKKTTSSWLPHFEEYCVDPVVADARRAIQQKETQFFKPSENLSSDIQYLLQVLSALSPESLIPLRNFIDGLAETQSLELPQTAAEREQRAKVLVFESKCDDLETESTKLLHQISALRLEKEQIELDLIDCKRRLGREVENSHNVQLRLNEAETEIRDLHKKDPQRHKSNKWVAGLKKAGFNNLQPKSNGIANLVESAKKSSAKAAAKGLVQEDVRQLMLTSVRNTPVHGTSGENGVSVMTSRQLTVIIRQALLAKMEDDSVRRARFQRVVAFKDFLYSFILRHYPHPKLADETFMSVILNTSQQAAESRLLSAACSMLGTKKTMSTEWQQIYLFAFAKLSSPPKQGLFLAYNAAKACVALNWAFECVNACLPRLPHAAINVIREELDSIAFSDKVPNEPIEMMGRKKVDLLAAVDMIASHWEEVVQHSRAYLETLFKAEMCKAQEETGYVSVSEVHRVLHAENSSLQHEHACDVVSELYRQQVQMDEKDDEPFEGISPQVFSSIVLGQYVPILPEAPVETARESFSWAMDWNVLIIEAWPNVMNDCAKVRSKKTEPEFEEASKAVDFSRMEKLLAEAKQAISDIPTIAEDVEDYHIDQAWSSTLETLMAAKDIEMRLSVFNENQARSKAPSSPDPDTKKVTMAPVGRRGGIIKS